MSLILRRIERDALNYMLISAVQYQAAFYLAAWYGNWRGWQLLAELVIVLVMSIIGVRECFKANGGLAGRHFILRYCALGVPIGLKLAIASVLLGLVLNYGGDAVINATTFRNPILVHQYLAFVLALLFTFLYYWRVAFHLEKLRSLEEGMPGHLQKD